VTRSHIRVHHTEPPPAPQYRFWIGFVVIAFVLIAAFWWSYWHRAEFWDTHSSVQGTISETRVVVDHIRDSRYGGLIFYGLEAHVAYSIDGKAQDGWLVASKQTASREMLIAVQNRQPSTCLVTWLNGSPQYAKCRIENIPAEELLAP